MDSNQPNNLPAPTHDVRPEAVPNVGGDIPSEKGAATLPDEENRVHHPYSPSSLQSLEACPGYLSRSSDHVRTIIGTIAHKATETGLDDNRLDDDDAAAVAECLDFYERRKDMMIKARADAVEALTIELWGRNAGPGKQTYDAQVIAEREIPPIIELLETYLPIDDCKFNDAPPGAEQPIIVTATTAGYVDRVIIAHDGEHAELFDWKFGLWPVEKAENNLQGIAYVLGLFKRYPKLTHAKFFFKQPLLDSIQEASFTRADVPELYLRVQTVVARAREARQKIQQDDWSMARPMVPACNFCANLGRCVKVMEIACHIGSKFSPLQIPENITPSMVMSPSQTKLATQLMQVMAVWAKAFRGVLTDRVIRGDAPVPDGFRIHSQSDREIADAALHKKIALEYLTETEYTEALKVSITAVEKKIMDKSERGHKRSTVEEFQKKLADAGATKLGDPKIFLKATAT